MSTEETESDRRALLAEAQIYGVDLNALATSRPNGSSTLDWDVLRAAVDKVRPPSPA